MRRPIALLLTAALAGSGCASDRPATTAAGEVATEPAPPGGSGPVPAVLIGVAIGAALIIVLIANSGSAQPLAACTASHAVRPPWPAPATAGPEPSSTSSGETRTLQTAGIVIDDQARVDSRSADDSAGPGRRRRQRQRRSRLGSRGAGFDDRRPTAELVLRRVGSHRLGGVVAGPDDARRGGGQSSRRGRRLIGGRVRDRCRRQALPASRLHLHERRHRRTTQVLNAPAPTSGSKATTSCSAVPAPTMYRAGKAGMWCAARTATTTRSGAARTRTG